jgi:hypothetical protein
MNKHLFVTRPRGETGEPRAFSPSCTIEIGTHHLGALKSYIYMKPQITTP